MRTAADRRADAGRSGWSDPEKAIGAHDRPGPRPDVGHRGGGQRVPRPPRHHEERSALEVQAEKNSLALEQAIARLEQLRQTFALKRQSEAAELRDPRDPAGACRACPDPRREQQPAHGGQGALSRSRRPETGLEGQHDGRSRRRRGSPARSSHSGHRGLRARCRSARWSTRRTSARWLPASRRRSGSTRIRSCSSAGGSSSLAPLGVASSLTPKVRTFVALVSIQGSSPQLMPDLTASVEVADATRSNPAAAGTR